MNMPTSFHSSIFFLSFLIISVSSLLFTEASVPKSRTFKKVNNGPYFSDLNEYNANYRPLQISNHPFHLCFYSTTPNSHFLGLAMGTPDSLSSMRWVWQANPSRPVHENAKLIFGIDGNLVLVDADGRVAWQTHTANKGVVDIKLLPNGNLVLLDQNGGFVWQSFHYATNTLLVGQGLGPTNSKTNKLVNGAYSMVVGDKHIGLFYKSSQPSKPLPYFNLVWPLRDDPDFTNVTFNVASPSEGPTYANELRFDVSGWITNKLYTFAQPKYNSTFSILRLASDGNVRVFTYHQKEIISDWDETYTLFSRNRISECLLPEKCGSLGVCSDGQCVSCPTPKGLIRWSKECKPMKLPSCDLDAANVSYYKVDGVDHFLTTVSPGEWPVKFDECKNKCSSDCKCMAFFYRKTESRCLLTAQLNTLIKPGGSSSADLVAYIKYAK